MLTIKIAGIPIEIASFDERFASLCEPYLCTLAPRFTVALTQDEFDTEAALNPNALDWEVLSLATYRKLCFLAMDYDCILFHSSAVAVDGRGYLFAAPSGTGKSTHARLWRELLSNQVTTINDDKPLLRLIDGVWFVCGTPWNGKHGLGCNLQVPIQGICFLEQAEQNEIFRMESQSSIPRLLNQMLRPTDLDKMDRLLRLTEDLLLQIPMWRLRCLPKHSAAALCYQTMKGVWNHDIENQGGL